MSEADLHGHVTTVEYDWLYRPTRVFLPQAPYTTATRYDLVGNVLSETDANGHTTTSTYDGLDRVTSTTNAAGNVNRLQYDAAGNRTLEENLTTGLRTRFLGHDGLNRPTEVRQEFTDPLTGELTTYTSNITYLDAENVKVTTSPRGNVTRERFNGHDAVIERTIDATGLQLTTTFRYDGSGNLIAQKDSEGAVVDQQFGYDGLGRRITATVPLGGLERSFYDGNGNVVRTIDRRGIVRTSTFDRLDRKVRETLTESISNAGAELVVSAVAYDDVANSSILTDANLNTTRQEQDAQHRTVRMIDALNQETRTEWDGENKVAEVDAAHTRTEFTYDVLDRLVRNAPSDRRWTDRRDHAISGRPEHSHRHRPAPRHDPDATETVLQFDPLQRLRRTSRRHPDLASRYGQAELVLSENTYDSDGNVTRTIDANGHVGVMEYDGAGRVVRVTEGAGTVAAASTAFTYDKAGNLLTTKDGRGHGGAFDLRYTYDVRNRKVLAENGAGEVKAYAYDQGDNLIGVTDPKGGAHRTTYTYDELNQLLSVDETRGGAGGVTRYRYDANRNRVSQQDASGNLTTYRYDALNRQTDSFQHTTTVSDEASARHWRSEYDAKGNQTLLVDAESQRVVKRYDQLDRLILKQYSNHRPGPDGDALPRLLSIAYTYDATATNDASMRPSRPGRHYRRDQTSMDYDRSIGSFARPTTTARPSDSNTTAPATRRPWLTRMAQERTTRFDSRGALVDRDGVVRDHTLWYWPDGLQRTITYPNGVVQRWVTTTPTVYGRSSIIRAIATARSPGSITPTTPTATD